ncbi:BAG family molecular chaperone regulator 2 [Euphorbia peplus]|nr:BAG family molecular chaperone regulator 2 [Euphorbia peplus]
MMRMKTKPTGLSHMNGGSIPRGGGGGGEAGSEWEVRPGGMLVQKRNPDSERSSIPPPTIRVRVKYGSTYHELHINSQATFGELKKLLSGPTGLHHQDQKLLFKDKERDSKAYLDTSGVKDKSKIVLVEDPISQEKRYLEMRKNATMEKAAKSISEISLQVDSLAAQVSALESVIAKGGKVAEKDVLNLIELLMNQLLKLDGIMADGDVKLQRKMQVKRVQKYVETLDVLKMKNSMPKPNTQNQQKQSNGHTTKPRHFNGHRLVTIDEEQPRRSVGNLLDHDYHHQRQGSGAGVVVTTQWETFDSTPTLAQSSSTSTNQNNRSNNQQPSFPWDLLS